MHLAVFRETVRTFLGVGSPDIQNRIHLREEHRGRVCQNPQPANSYNWSRNAKDPCGVSCGKKLSVPLAAEFANVVPATLTTLVQIFPTHDI